MRHIHLLATGGTIAGAAESAAMTTGYRAAALGIEALCSAVPGLEDAAHITTEQVAALDSKNATPEFWRILGRRVQAAADGNADGIVITHGTDTLEETAYYLQLTLKTAKPVVLVGAMRPSTSLSADGPLNLLNAVRIAASAQATGRGVMVALNQQVFGARDAAKLDTMRVDTFGAPNAGPLGQVQDERVIWTSRAERLHTLASPFDADTPLAPVEILLAYAGASPRLIDAAAAGASGLVWAGTGNGSTSDAALEALGRAAAAGVAVVRASRTQGGFVTPLAQPRAGWYSADTLSPYKARVLLMLALGTGLSGEALQRVFDTC